jgi:hypothetical protein
MHTLVIIFLGLISHVALTPGGGQPPEQIAVLVDAMDHAAQLVVTDGQGLTVSGGSFPNFHISGTTVYDISGHKLTISGIAAVSKMQFSTGFSNYVPSLMLVTDGTDVTSDVKTKNHKGKQIKTIVELPLGTLSVGGYYPTQASNLNYRQNCVAKTVVYSGQMATTSKVIVITSEDGRTIGLRPDATITIQNLPTKKNMKPHYFLYKELTNARNIGAWTVYADKCTTSTSKPSKLDTVECSNSHFP